MKRGLHPFYPATVQILRPRFIGPVAGAVASHPMLKLKNWDPWRTLTELGLLIQCFLEVGPRLSFFSFAHVSALSYMLGRGWFGAIYPSVPPCPPLSHPRLPSFSAEERIWLLFWRPNWMLVCELFLCEFMCVLLETFTRRGDDNYSISRGIPTSQTCPNFNTHMLPS